MSEFVLFSMLVPHEDSKWFMSGDHAYVRPVYDLYLDLDTGEFHERLRHWSKEIQLI